MSKTPILDLHKPDFDNEIGSDLAGISTSMDTIENELRVPDKESITITSHGTKLLGTGGNIKVLVEGATTNGLSSKPFILRRLGKNQFDKINDHMLDIGGYEHTVGTLDGTKTNCLYSINPIQVLSSQDIVVSRTLLDGDITILEYDKDKTFIQSTTANTITTSATTMYIQLELAHSVDIDTELDYIRVQVEYGTVATDWEHYSKREVEVDWGAGDGVGRSINSVTDEINLYTGESFIRNASSGVTIDSLDTTGTNVDVCVTTAFTDNTSWANLDGNIDIKDKTEIDMTAWDDVANQGDYWKDSDNIIRFVVAKGLYADVAEAQEAFNDVDVLYPLAKAERITAVNDPLILSYSRGDILLLVPSDETLGTLPTLTIELPNSTSGTLNSLLQGFSSGGLISYSGDGGITIDAIALNDVVAGQFVNLYGANAIPRNTLVSQGASKTFEYYYGNESNNYSRWLSVNTRNRQGKIVACLATYYQLDNQHLSPITSSKGGCMIRYFNLNNDGTIEYNSYYVRPFDSRFSFTARPTELTYPRKSFTYNRNADPYHDFTGIYYFYNTVTIDDSNRYGYIDSHFHVLSLENTDTDPSVITHQDEYNNDTYLDGVDTSLYYLRNTSEPVISSFPIIYQSTSSVPRGINKITYRYNQGGSNHDYYGGYYTCDTSSYSMGTLDISDGSASLTSPSEWDEHYAPITSRYWDTNYSSALSRLGNDLKLTGIDEYGRYNYPGTIITSTWNTSYTPYMIECSDTYAYVVYTREISGHNRIVVRLINQTNYTSATLYSEYVVPIDGLRTFTHNSASVEDSNNYLLNDALIAIPVYDENIGEYRILKLTRSGTNVNAHELREIIKFRETSVFDLNYSLIRGSEEGILWILANPQHYLDTNNYSPNGAPRYMCIDLNEPYSDISTIDTSYERIRALGVVQKATLSGETVGVSIIAKGATINIPSDDLITGNYYKEVSGFLVACSVDDESVIGIATDTDKLYITKEV